MKCKYYILTKWYKGVKIVAKERGIDIWLPISQVKIDGDYVVEIPEWLAKENKLKPELNAELTPTT